MDHFNDRNAQGLGVPGTLALLGCTVANGAFVLGLICMVDSVWAQQPAEGPSRSESRVDRIRDRLVDRAIEAPVRISSNAWLDESGQFRHVTRLYSEIRSRALADLGVESDRTRLEVGLGGVQSDPSPGAGQSAAETPVATVTAPPPGGQGASGECSRTTDGLRRFARIHPALRPHDGSQGLDSLSRVARIASDTLLQKGMSQGPLQPILLDGDPSSSYEHRLTSDGRFDIPYRIDITIRSAGPLETSLRPGAFLSMREVIIEMGLVERASGRRLAVRHESIILPGPRPEVGRSIPPPDSDALIESFVERWYQDAEAAVSCEPLRVAGRPEGRSVFSISVGARAGVRVGDRWLLIDAARIPARTLEPGALKGVQLAEVVSVGQYRSSLKLETPEGTASEASPPDRGAQWIAVPL
ncbi:MAG: hypothetical protein RL322_2407 [Pseudomonadota bacterium]|jgi:hypothetical protein